MKFKGNNSDEGIMTINDINTSVEDNTTEDEWEGFIKESCGGGFLTFKEYLNQKNIQFKYIIARDTNNKIAGCIIARIRGGQFPVNLIAKSFWIESGILIRKEFIEEKAAIKRLLLDRLTEEAKKINATVVKFNHWSREREYTLFEELNYNHSNNTTILIDLKKEEKALFSALSKGHKSTVKKAIKNNLEFKTYNSTDNEGFKDFMRLYEETFQRAIAMNKNSSMTKRDASFFNIAFQNNTRPFYLMNAVINEKVAASGIFVQNGDTLIYFIGASDISLNRQYGASNFLIWNTILWAKENGLNYFDLGGVPDNPDKESPAYGVYRFKKNFGGELTTFYGGEKTISPLKNSILKWTLDNRNIYRTFSKIFKG